MAAVTADKWTSNGKSNVEQARAALSNVINKIANVGIGGANRVAQTVANQMQNPVRTTTTTTSGGGGTPTYSGGTTGGTTSGSTGGGTSRKAVRTDMDATPVYDATAVYQRYLNELRQKADSAYMTNMARIKSAYESSQNNLANNLSTTKSNLQNTYNKSARTVRDDSEQALRDSYVNYMMNRRNLGQELSALGLNGGAAESTLGSLLNNYGSSRNNIETTRNRNLADLGEALQNGMAQAESAYTNALNNLISRRLSEENAAENARQNLLANYATNLSSLATSDNTYLDTLRSLRDQMGAVELAPTAATNTYTGANVQQGLATPGVENAYARYLAQAQMMRDNGQSDDAIKDYLFSSVGNNSSALSQIFAQLGLL